MERDIRKGLSTIPKTLPSKYFYDDTGSRIFQEIMLMEEYYPTDSEFEIFRNRSGEIVRALGFKDGFNIIELGAGDGTKTRELLKRLTSQEINFTYRPIDISSEAIESLRYEMKKELPNLDIRPLTGDYFRVLEGYSSDKPNLFLFLGSNIGNYEEAGAIALLRKIHGYMNRGDKLLIGFDLRKNPHTILKAYNDEGGVTRRFNLNLLKRLNRELGANFNLSKFEFYPYYDPKRGEVRSSLVSLEDQQVYFPSLDTYFQFTKDELVYTELSKKYSFEEIENLAQSCGFENQEHFLDQKAYFSDSLWVKLT